MGISWETPDGKGDEVSMIVVDTNVLNGLLWTGDQALIKGLRAKGFERFFEPDS